MKKSIYDKLEDIPQIDRDENNYALCTDSGSPNNGKYVLLLDGTHPVQAKNTELLSEKATKTAETNGTIQQKDAAISRLTNELTTAKSTSLPTGHFAISAEDFNFLNQVKPFGKPEEIKAKVEEHAKWKESVESNDRKTLFTEAATAHGLNASAFISLAEPQKLHETLFARETVDGKGNKTKQYFVKGKNEKNEETETLLSEFVKNNDVFKPFTASLFQKADNKVKIPDQGHGLPPTEKKASDTYISSRYKRPDAKSE